MKTVRVAIALSLLLAISPLLSAQLRSPNVQGVSAAHVILLNSNVDVHNRFWISLGGSLTDLGRTRTSPSGQLFGVQLVRFPGIGISGSRPGEIIGFNPGGQRITSSTVAGLEESRFDYLGFKVKNLKDSLSRWQAAGINPLPNQTSQVVYLVSPDNLKIRIVEDSSISSAIESDEVLMKVPSSAEAAAWYARWLGAEIVQSGGSTLAKIPGLNIRFAEANSPTARMETGALQVLGFEVSDIESLAAKLKSAGVPIIGPLSAVDSQFDPLKSFVRIMDPWGTFIELSDGFRQVLK